MILIIDNYDSFVFNLARYVGELGHARRVVRNDQISVADIATLAPSHIILSPGPKAPDQAGICLQVIKNYAGKIPILGVCLGHQAIGQAFGAKVQRATRPLHGQASVIQHQGGKLFKNLPRTFKVARYHSLIVNDLPDCLQIQAVSEENEIMALAHQHLPVYGVQFHPESVLTEHGHALINNFLTYD